MDGALCLFLLLALAARRGSDRSERRAVGLGLIVGLLLTVDSWLAWPAVSGLLPGAMPSLLSLGFSGAVALLSLPLLAATIRHFRYPPQHRLRAPFSWLTLLFFLSNGILLRDALEVIPSMTIIASYSPAAVLGFVGAGIAIVGMVSILVTLERRAAQNLGLVGATLAGFSGFQRVSAGFSGFQRVSAGFSGFQRVSARVLALPVANPRRSHRAACHLRTLHRDSADGHRDATPNAPRSELTNVRR
ncbi:MAG: hypothetical protein GY811_21085 [Myxococcales bacterium]|nr:hypothetical protein [Myxococcales bacterium]